MVKPTFEYNPIFHLVINSNGHFGSDGEDKIMYSSNGEKEKVLENTNSTFESICREAQ